MITFTCIKTINEAEKIWKALSPLEEIYDEWIYRYLYYKFTEPDIEFYVAYDNDDAVGLLPLQWNEKEKYLEFFGGQFASYNSIFIKKGYEHVRELLINQLTKPAYIRWLRDTIDRTDVKDSGNTYNLQLDGLHSVDDFLQQNLRSKRRNELKRQMRKIDELQPTVFLDRLSDYDTLVTLNRKKFGEESLFFLPNRTEFFREAMNHFTFHTHSVEIKGEICAVSLRIEYKNKIYGINSGVKEGINNLPKFLFLKTIELGISLGLKEYDALDGDHGWKENFHFKPRQQYMIDLRSNGVTV